MQKITGIRGMNDISPADSPAWQFIEARARDVLARYGYQEIRPPIVERTELFRRSVGEGTDIVEKEMYTFADRKGESLTLRPECTASCVRAAVEHGWLSHGGRRVWHMGPMFRYERPQKGRYRQFHQLDVEALGFAGPDVDAELIMLSARLWQELGLDGLGLEINSLGSREVQAAYRARLVAYMNDHREELDEDSARRLNTNPLRILDSKNPRMQAVVEAAPRLIDQLDATGREHFDGVRSMLDAAGVAYRVNPFLVRGLDYYTGPVFEWVTEHAGAQNAVCGGGRYDHLIADIGGGGAPATGFAMGLERIIALLAERQLTPAEPVPDAYLVAVGSQAQVISHQFAEHLRSQLVDLKLVVDASAGNFKTKLKRADRSGARVALILGEDEARTGQIGVKRLRESGEQLSMPQSELEAFLRG